MLSDSNNHQKFKTIRESATCFTDIFICTSSGSIWLISSNRGMEMEDVL